MTLGQIVGLLLSIAAFVGLIWYRTHTDRRDQQRARQDEPLTASGQPQHPGAGR